MTYPCSVSQLQHPPYIRHLPIELTTSTSEGESFRTTTQRPSFRDPCTNQWTEFARCVYQGVSPDALLEDASNDVRLAIEITTRGF